CHLARPLRTARRALVCPSLAPTRTGCGIWPPPSAGHPPAPPRPRAPRHRGDVLRAAAALRDGRLRGSHGPAECWIYRPHSGGVEMLFGFYANFSPDDLICKVSAIGETVPKGAGASIQSNGDRSTMDEGGAVALIHGGRWTVSSGISRRDCVEAIHTAAPEV